MSFNYNPLSTAMPPMHLIAPPASSFLSKLPPNLLASQSQQQQQQQQQQQTHKPPETLHFAQAPMDLENPNESAPGNGCEHSEDNGNDLMFNGILPQSFMMLPGVMMDPSLLGLQQFPALLNLPQQQVTTSPEASASKSNGGEQANGNQTAKEVIHCASCTLIPPNPNAPAPTTRERPPGCRTVFVGGLPENITESMIHEIFERCGEITTLRLSKKNFCHIRFVYEASVESAIYLSGYRVKIGNSSEPSNTGRLHVDYAQARDDQYEYECRQRQLQREQRHREKDRFRSSSPPSVPHYSEHEATSVAEKIKHDESFLKAVQTLVTWLERGDCSKKNANIFYSMIQSTNSHIRRLQSERSQHEDEYNEARNAYRKQMIKMNEQFNQIEKVFNAANKKKVWDHFTKPQRKNIDQWCKQATDVREFRTDVASDNEMEMSDDQDEEEGGCKASKRVKLDKVKRKDENRSRSSRSLSRDLDPSTLEQRVEAELRGKQIKVLQETIRNLQRKLLETTTRERQSEARISELEESVRESGVKELLLRTKIVNARSTSQSVDDCSETSSLVERPVASMESCGAREAHLMSLATAFLVIHPNGASVDAIRSYAQEFATAVGENELIEVLARHERLFRLANEDGLWHYCGFSP